MGNKEKVTIKELPNDRFSNFDYMIRLKKGLGLLLLIACIQVSAQPFKEEITSFKQQDSVLAPPAHAILFVGSSSFTKWKDVQNYFPRHKIINRGFGGSSLTHVIDYANDIIFPYKPKQIVIYCGENDIAAAESATGNLVFERFKTLFGMIRTKMPIVPLMFISLKPSPSRWAMRARMQEANRLIKAWLLTKANTKFIDVWTKMLDNDGMPMKDIFLDDRLHMNAKGYVIWQKVIEPGLVN